MQLQGYIMDEEEYEVTPAIKRVVSLFETEPNINPSRGQTDGLTPEPEMVEFSAEMIWEPGSLATPASSKLTSEVIVDQSVLFTEYSLSNARDCVTISDDCPVLSPRTQVSINDGASFIDFNFPIQVLPGHILRSYLLVVDESIDASITVRGYINVI